MTDNPDSPASPRSTAHRLLDVLKTPAAARLVESAVGWLTSPRERPAGAVRQRANRAAAADLDWFQGLYPSGGYWARTEYGEYYATSVSVYSAIKLRAEALSRPNLLVHRRGPDGQLLPVGPGHPAQQLLDRVNPWYTRGDLWRATEVYLNLWGSCFWALEQDETGRREIWPLRPDRVSILPDGERYIRGFVYMGRNGPVAYTPEEMLWMRYFNPLEERAGLSPVAPLRLAVDMGKDGLRYNRNFFRNSAQPDFVLLTDEAMTDAEVQDFYEQWEARYRGPAQAHRPAIASFVRDIKTLGFSHKDMDFIQGLRWSLEEVSPRLRRPQAAAVRPGAGHLRQHQRGGAAVLAQHHTAGDAVHRGAAHPDAPAPGGLSGAGGPVRPGVHRGPAGGREQPGAPGGQHAGPGGAHHQRGAALPQPAGRSLGRLLVRGARPRPAHGARPRTGLTHRHPNRPPSCSSSHRLLQNG